MLASCVRVTLLGDRQQGMHHMQHMLDATCVSCLPVCRSLCSFTHPMANGATFNNLNSLKRRLLEQHKLHFCDLCIKGRKVCVASSRGCV